MEFISVICKIKYVKKNRYPLVKSAPRTDSLEACRKCA